MPVEDSPPAAPSAAADAPAAARRLLRLATKASLATLLARMPGHPYASLVLLATEPDGTPLFLISRLALHTQNLAGDARASLLLDGTDGLADPLTGGRITLIGHARPVHSATAHARFLARHPAAQAYASFADFTMHALHVAQAHYVGGFGRIQDLSPADLACAVGDAQALVAAEPDILAHMNADHRDAVALYATELAHCPAGDWRMAGIDPDGIDLLHRSNAARIDFPARVRTPAEARAALVALAKQARDRQGSKA
jgi:putative heme iron utilization protein